MNTTGWPETRSPEEMQRDIRARRMALDEKVQEIERRLSPKARLQDLRTDLTSRVNSVDRDAATAWAAAIAVGLGAWMAFSGWRRSHAAIEETPGDWVELCCTCGQPI